MPHLALTGVSLTFSDIPSSITSTKPDRFDGTGLSDVRAPIPRVEAVLYPGNQKHSMAGHNTIRAELQEDANCIVRREDVMMCISLSNACRGEIPTLSLWEREMNFIHARYFK